MFRIREIDDDLRKDIRRLTEENWGSTIMISRGQLYHIDKLPGYVAIEDSKIVGLITYSIQNDECEIVSLDSLIKNKGIGMSLIDIVVKKCEKLRCNRLWLITTNDNTNAIKFYQKRGFNINAIYLNSIEKARMIKPEIPLFGYDNIPILHEIEFERILIDEDIRKNLSLSYNKRVDYREKRELQPWKISEINRIINYIKEEKKTKLLDLGAGTGKQAEIFKNNGVNITCIDISREMIEACREKGLDAYVMDFYNLIFPDEAFDAVWSMNTLLHIPKNNIKRILNNIKGILRPKGIFYLGMYGGHDSEGIWEEDFYNPKRFFAFYEDEEIKEIVKDYFDIIEFNIIPIEENKMHYQSLILRKKNTGKDRIDKLSKLEDRRLEAGEEQ